MEPKSLNSPPPFERTVCDCARCVRCCKEQPGPLAPGDFERITEALNLSPDEAKKRFVAAPAASLFDFIALQRRQVGTITPRSKKGRCVFLDEADRCSIHAIAPFGCAYFDMHMPMDEADRRSLYLANLQEDPEYQRLRDTLPLADDYLERRHEIRSSLDSKVRRFT